MKIIICVILVFIYLPAQAQSIKSKGPKGVLHFTDEVTNTPTGNTVLSSTTGTYNLKKSPSHNLYNPVVPRAILSIEKRFVHPDIIRHCSDLLEGHRSLMRTCIEVELRGQVFFWANFIPEEVKKYCRSLVGHSWSLMKTCSQSLYQEHIYLSYERQ